MLCGVKVMKNCLISYLTKQRMFFLVTSLLLVVTIFLSLFLGAAKLSFNEVLEGFGIESVASISHKHDFEYVNLGDSYCFTICDYKGKLRITSWGDIVENNMDDFE